MVGKRPCDENKDGSEYTSSSSSGSDSEPDVLAADLDDDYDEESESDPELNQNSTLIERKRERNAVDECVNKINVTFEFFDMMPDDYHVIRHMLSTMVDGAPLNIVELAEHVSNQSCVGTTVKSIDESASSALAFITALRFDSRVESLRQWRSYVRSKLMKSKVDIQRFDSLFDGGKSSRRTGIVMQHRVKNLPLELVAPMYQALYDDLRWAVANVSKTDYKFDDLLFMVRSDTRKDDQTRLKRKNKKQKRMNRQTEQNSREMVDSVSFQTFDGEILAASSTWMRSFPVSVTSDSNVPHQSQFQTLILIPTIEIPAIVASMQRKIGISLIDDQRKR